MRQYLDVKARYPDAIVFFRLGDDVFHAYSAYARGTEALTDTYSLLDTTPYGRQETWESSPEGWPQASPYEWWRRHDEYKREDAGSA